jgi:hypothetical protein
MPASGMRARAPGWISAKAVGSYVPGLTKKAFEKFGFSAAALVTDWEKVAGSRFAAFTAPQRLKWPNIPHVRDAIGEEGERRPGATLVLMVDPAHALDAEYGAAQLIDRINAYFGYRAVAEIRLIQAPLTAAEPPTPSANPVRTAAPSVQSRPSAGRRLEEALARLEAGVMARRP